MGYTRSCLDTRAKNLRKRGKVCLFTVEKRVLHADRAPPSRDTATAKKTKSRQSCARQFEILGPFVQECDLMCAVFVRDTLALQPKKGHQGRNEFAMVSGERWRSGKIMGAAFAIRGGLKGMMRIHSSQQGPRQKR